MDYVDIAQRWCTQNVEHADSGIVMIWTGQVYGWKNCTGWLTVAVLATTLANLRLRISKNIYKARMVSAEENAVTWKRQAGKAYTELLKTRSGTDNAATLIPVGSRIDCTMKTSTVNGQTIAQCEDDVIYTPHEY